MLELITLKQLDPQHCNQWPELLQEVQDEEARVFISKCLGPLEQRPTAEQLINDPFFALRPAKQAGLDSDLSASTKSLGGLEGPAGTGEKRKTDTGSLSGLGGGSGDGSGQGNSGDANIAVGRLKGEDYEFVFTAKMVEGKLHFTLTMLGVTKPGEENQLKRDIEFVFDPETDTADSLAGELSQQFSLSPTDTEICAAALKEYLAGRGLLDEEGNGREAE